MARHSGYVQIYAVSAILSFWYIYGSLEKHWLAAQPRLSSAITLILSGLFSLAAGRWSTWLPASNERFIGASQNEDNTGLLSIGDDRPKEIRALMPQRPGKNTLPLMIACIIIRLEAMHRINFKRQCSTPGIESFLCFLLFLYDVFAARRKWGVPPPEDPDDPWRTVFDDLHDWFTGPRVSMVVACTCLFYASMGTYFALGANMRSSFICFDLLDSKPWIFFLQLLRLGLDAAICLFAWRLMSWSPSVNSGIRTLGKVLFYSGLSMAAVWVLTTLASDVQAGFNYRVFPGLEVVLDGLFLAIFAISATYWMCDTSPIIPSSILTIGLGLVVSLTNIFHFGDWLHVYRGVVLIPLGMLVFTSISFFRSHGIHSVVFKGRRVANALIIFCLVVGIITAFVKHTEQFLRNPLSDLVFKATFEHNKYRTEATTSARLKVAVQMYEERYTGKTAPPNFADWYEFAKNTLIIDVFDQIDTDLAPFWKLSPEALRKRAEAAVSIPGVHSITIKGGQVTHSKTGDEGLDKDLQELASMVEGFSNHLPDMVLPINLDPSPRVLPSSKSVESLNQQDITPSTLQYKESITDAEFRNMYMEACPRRSDMNKKPSWKVEEFCSRCIQKHSKGPIIYVPQKALKTCWQPDLVHLHDFYLSKPQLAPIPEFLPLFSFAKTDAFQDIVIPIPRAMPPGEPDKQWGFDRRYDSLYFRGTMEKEITNPQLLRGGLKYRALDLLLGRSGTQNEISTVLPFRFINSHQMKETNWHYEQVKTTRANQIAPLNLGLRDSGSCQGRYCDMAKKAYGAQDGDPEEALEYRYVLLLDEERGPPRDFMRTLQSGSVPLVSTIFRTWYTERIQPWQHYVPIDPRFQSLHTSYIFFTGTKDRGVINGREPNFRGRDDNGEWIAQQGQRWAGEVLQRKDMEAYIFRLLLEWGRLIDDNRDTAGFRNAENGEFANTGFTPAREAS